MGCMRGVTSPTTRSRLTISLTLTRSRMAPTQEGLVLVTGVSGCVGSAVALAFLAAGYRVRGTVRSQAKADAWTAAYPQWSDSIEFALVGDMSSAGAFDDAMVGVTLVAHTASPFFYGFTDNEKEVLQPAIRGTLEVLESAKKAATVERIVITSSFAAMQNYSKALWPEHTYTEDDWCELEYAQAAKEEKDQLLVYVASKKLAEKAAWDFVAEHKPNFTLSTICPSFVLGRAPQPLRSIEDLNTSAAWIRKLIDATDLSAAEIGIPSMVDINTVADAHVKAVTLSAAQGERFLLMGPLFSASMVAHELASLFPEQRSRFPPSKNEEPGPHYSWDSSKAERVLGIKFQTLRETVQQAAEQIFELEKK